MAEARGSGILGGMAAPPRSIGITIRGHHLPGRAFASTHGTSSNVHVAVQERADPLEPVPGDAASATWDIDVGLVTTADGDLDFRGPVVHGKRNERFVYLTWGDVGADGSFAMFRRAKLMLGQVDPKLITAVERDGRRLVADVHLTDDCGGPRCARLGPPALTWSLG
jgi:hypothetical protein